MNAYWLGPLLLFLTPAVLGAVFGFVAGRWTRTEDWPYQQPPSVVGRHPSQPSHVRKLEVQR